MTTLKDGRFVFIHAERQHLLVEQPAPVDANGNSNTAGSAAAKANTAVPISTQLLYGGTVHAFALNASQNRIALICPAGTATGAAAQASAAAQQSVLRLFAFANGEVGELLFDEPIPAMVEGVVWAGDRFVALDVRAAEEPSDGQTPAAPAALFTMLIEMVRAPKRLKLLREDKSAASPVAGPGTTLCDIHTAKQSLRLWDVQRNKLLTESPLPNRKCRHGKGRVAVSASSDGPFVFVVNNDWTVHGFYVGRNGVVHTPRSMLTQFESQITHQTAQRAKNASKTDAAANAEDGKGAPETSTPSPPPTAAASATASNGCALPVPRLFTQAVSDTQVLVALRGSPTVMQCAYDTKGKEEEWRMEAKMRLPRRLHGTAEIVGLSTTKCLMYQRGTDSSDTAVEGVDAEAATAGVYFVLPLEMKPIHAVPAEAAVGQPGEPTEGQSSKLPNTEGAKEADASTTATAAAAAAPAASTAEAPEDPSPTDGGEKRKKKKKKNKKKKAAAAAEEQASAPSTPPAEQRRGPGGPTQRAVDRLLVHAGISAKDQLPNAFNKEPAAGKAEAEAAHGGGAGPVEEVSGVAATDSSVLTPAVAKGAWVSSDVMMTVGGVVVGVVVGVLVMRRLALL